MRKSKYSEHQIIDVLRRAESGVPVKDLCRELGISSATFYQWRSKFGGMEASDLKRLRDLEEESRRQACRCVGLSRSVLDYVPRPRNDGPVIQVLTDLAERFPRYGFRKLFVLLRRAGYGWNHKKVWRVYCAMKLNKRVKFKRRRPVEQPQPLLQPIRPNQAWSADFMSDALYNGTKYRTFNVIDDYNREALRVEVDVSLTAERVVRVLEQLIGARGSPERLRVDHGPEFTSAIFEAWGRQRGITLEFIEPGKPNQNGFIERFNGTYRDGVLDAWVFMSLDEVREETERWLAEYNLERPHESLGHVPPIEFLTQRGHADVSTYAWP
jgi:putative transposase